MGSHTVTPRFRQGAGRLCLDFVRTSRRRGTPDAEEELSGPAALAAWTTQLGPCAAEPDEVGGTEGIAEAHALREAVHQLLRAACGPQGVAGCAPAARELVNRAAALPVPAPSLDAGGRLRWQAYDPVRATLALVARDALDLVDSPAVGRVRECAGPGCSALFLDSSRPGTRRWCSMDVCGNRAKKRALHQRARRA